MDTQIPSVGQGSLKPSKKMILLNAIFSKEFPLTGFRLPFAVSNILTSHPIILLVACLWIVFGSLFSAFID